MNLLLGIIIGLLISILIAVLMKTKAADAVAKTVSRPFADRRSATIISVTDPLDDIEL